MDKLKKAWDWAGKKLIVTLAGLIIASLKAAHPDWPLPSEEAVTQLVVAFLAAHSATDIMYLLKTQGKDVVKEVVGKL